MQVTHTAQDNFPKPPHYTRYTCTVEYTVQGRKRTASSTEYHSQKLAIASWAQGWRSQLKHTARENPHVTVIMETYTIFDNFADYLCSHDDILS